MSQEEELVAVSELVSQSSSGGEGEAQALSGSPLVEKQECFSFPRQRSTSDEMAVHCVDAKGGGDQALPSLSLQRQYQVETYFVTSLRKHGDTELKLRLYSVNAFSYPYVMYL